MKLTGAAILVSRDMKVLQAAPAAYPYRSALKELWLLLSRPWDADMNYEWACTEAAAAAILRLAEQQGIDLAQYCRKDQFLNQANGRYIHLEMHGTAVGYYIQGGISLLPAEFAKSADEFHGVWGEGGTLPDIERALVFVRAWLLDGAEVDHLPVPERERGNRGIN